MVIVFSSLIDKFFCQFILIIMFFKISCQQQGKN